MDLDQEKSVGNIGAVPCCVYCGSIYHSSKDCREQREGDGHTAILKKARWSVEQSWILSEKSQR